MRADQRKKNLDILRIVGLIPLAINAIWFGIKTPRMKIPLYGIVLALIFALIYLILSSQISQTLKGKERHLEQLQKMVNWPLIVKLLTMLLGICEEFAFRGAVFSITLKLTESPVSAIVVGSVTFALWHLLYEGSKEAVPSHILFGLLTGVLVYIYPGNIWLPIITHMVVHVAMMFTRILILLSGYEAAF